MVGIPFFFFLEDVKIHSLFIPEFVVKLRESFKFRSELRNSSAVPLTHYVGQIEEKLILKTTAGVTFVKLFNYYLFLLQVDHLHNFIFFRFSMGFVDSIIAKCKLKKDKIVRPD